MLRRTLPAGVQVRESKVRRAGIGGRARLAGELRDMDDEVGSRHGCTTRLHLLCIKGPSMHPVRVVLVLLC